MRYDKLKLQYICSKYPEMARKLVKNDFLISSPPHPKKLLNKIGYLKKFVKKWKKIKVVPNCLKWSANWSNIIFGFCDPPFKEKKTEKVLDDKK